MHAQQLLVPSYLQTYSDITEAFKIQRRATQAIYQAPYIAETTDCNAELENYIISQVYNDGLWLSFGTPKTGAPNFINTRKKLRRADQLFSFEGSPESYDIKDINKPIPKSARKGGLLLGLKPKRIEQLYISTLAEFLFWKPGPCAFVHLNCESFSSTITILNSLYSNRRIVRGTVILFDKKQHLQLFKMMKTTCFSQLWEQTTISIPSSVMAGTAWEGIALKQR
jgi:hypothetical protein